MRLNINAGKRTTAKTDLDIIAELGLHKRATAAYLALDSCFYEIEGRPRDSVVWAVSRTSCDEFRSLRPVFNPAEMVQYFTTPLPHNIINRAAVGADHPICRFPRNCRPRTIPSQIEISLPRV